MIIGEGKYVTIEQVIQNALHWGRWTTPDDLVAQHRHVCDDRGVWSSVLSQVWKRHWRRLERRKTPSKHSANMIWEYRWRDQGIGPEVAEPPFAERNARRARTAKESAPAEPSGREKLRQQIVELDKLGAQLQCIRAALGEIGDTPDPNAELKAQLRALLGSDG